MAGHGNLSWASSRLGIILPHCTRVLESDGSFWMLFGMNDTRGLLEKTLILVPTMDTLKNIRIGTGLLNSSGDCTLISRVTIAASSIRRGRKSAGDSLWSSTENSLSRSMVFHPESSPWLGSEEWCQVTDNAK